MSQLGRINEPDSVVTGRSRSRRGRAAAAVVAFAMLAAGCSGNEAKTSAPVAKSTTTAATGSDPNVVTGGEFTIGVEAAPESLDPLFGNNGATSSTEGYTASAMFDPLVAPGSGGLPGELRVASKVEHNDAFTEWTVTIRDGITFHDGTKLDAAAVVANYTYRAEAANCPCSKLYEGLTATAVDESTVRFDLVTGDAHFEGRRLIDDLIAPSTLVPGADRDRAPVGSGPFRLVDRDTLTFERNEDYWRSDDRGRSLPYLDGIRFAPIPVSTVRLAALQRGEVDLMEVRDGATIKAVEADEELAVLRSGSSGAIVVIANLRRERMQNPDTRLALALAIDREALAVSYVEAAYQPAYSFFSPDEGLGITAESPQRDLAEAKRLAKKVEAADGPEALQLNLVCAKLPEAEALLPVALNQIKEAGFDANLTYLDVGEYAAQVVAGRGDATWDLACAPTPSFDADPSTLGPFLITDSASNPAGYSNPEVDRLFEQDLTTVDLDDRREIYQKISDAVVEDLPYLPLLYSSPGIASTRTVQGVKSSDPTWPMKADVEFLWRKGG